jgi:hypothetical protein
MGTLENIDVNAMLGTDSKSDDLPFGAQSTDNAVAISCTDRYIWRLVDEAENKALYYKLYKTPGKISPYTLIVYGSPSETASFRKFIERTGKED